MVILTLSYKEYLYDNSVEPDFREFLTFLLLLDPKAETVLLTKSKSRVWWPSSWEIMTSPKNTGINLPLHTTSSFRLVSLHILLIQNFLFWRTWVWSVSERLNIMRSSSIGYYIYSHCYWQSYMLIMIWGNLHNKMILIERKLQEAEIKQYVN